MPCQQRSPRPSGGLEAIGTLCEALEARRLLRTSPLQQAAESALVSTVLQMPQAPITLGVDDMLALLPAASPTVAAAFTRVMDLSQYTVAQLASASQWVFVADVQERPVELARELGAQLVTPSGVLPGAFIADFSNLEFPGEVLDSFGGAEIVAYYPLVSLDRSGRLIPNDPLFSNQWHLRNTGQGSGLVGADANVTGVWDSYQGAGVTIGVVDDGVYPTHQDISPNFVLAHSWDWVGNDNNPAGGGHGTNVAGVAAGRGSNGLGVSGAAPLASIAGLRLLGAGTDTNEAAALSYHRDDIDIYNNSWGPNDNGSTLEGPGPLTLAALEQTARLGRGGLGSIFVWAGGNGGQAGDNANKDGYVNSRHTISVAAITNLGGSSSYSEDGANHLVSAYSNGGSLGITTTSGSSTSYTSSFGGTSSASPLAAGVVALMLEANPNLTARDVQHILVRTARKISPSHSSWAVNGAGYNISHRFGFGAVDAGAAVALAQTWQGVGPEVEYRSGTQAVNAAIPNLNATGISRTISVPTDIRVEHVEVIIDIPHTARGNLEVFLTAPSGTVSQLLQTNFDANNNYPNWSLNSVRHWDELSSGDWTLRVADRSGADVGTWNSWSLNIFGTEAEAPAINGQQFEFESRHAVRVQFTQDVAASLAGSDLTVSNLTTGQAVAAQLFSYDVLTNTANFTFPGQPGGILADGNYTAQITGSVTNASGTPLAGAPVLEFFAIAGDANRDRNVDLADLGILRANFGQSPRTFSQGDFNLDTMVDLVDFAILRGNFGTFLPPPGGDGLFGGAGGDDGGGRDVLN